MKTAMKEMLDYFLYVRELDPYVQTILLEQRCKELMHAEKEQIMQAYKYGVADEYDNKEAYYNHTYKVEI